MSLMNSMLRKFGVKTKRMFIVQIELAGKCSATCEFCDWTRRPAEQKVFLKTEWAKKAVKEAKEMGADHISFHITGESLDHPDLFDIMPHDCKIGLSTNCLSLEGETAKKISRMRNLNLILAVLWAEPEPRFSKSLENAIKFLNMNPICRTISVQMICSDHAIKHAKMMYDIFSPYLEKYPHVKLFYKQPYSQEPEYQIMGHVPEGIPESSRVVIDKMPTPQSCGDDCLAVTPNPMTSMLIQSDGEIKPCFYRPNDPAKLKFTPEKFHHGWGLGHISTMSLQEAWDSQWLKDMRKIWATGDPHKQLPCYDCIRMMKPRNQVKWWFDESPIPTKLDCYQAIKGDPADPYPKPD